MTERFWETKTLEEMTHDEWESLCDGCGRCCMMKTEDAATGEPLYTNVSCPLLDSDCARCSQYETRFEHMPECIQLTPANVPHMHWLPQTCAYRRVADGRGLAWWHPLVSGRPETVHEAGISVQGKDIVPLQQVVSMSALRSAYARLLATAEDGTPDEGAIAEIQQIMDTLSPHAVSWPMDDDTAPESPSS